ncbi:MAG: ribosome-associated translation inhibitor RaiA [Bacillota bacterium]|nr:ribosome-associated translation inhibitor RaiA [Bacillota bacterium]
MKFVFTGRKVEVSDELKNYAQKKFEKLDRYFSKDATVHLTFSIERGRHLVEATVVQGGLFFRAVERTGDMYASIDSTVSIIDRQIKKNKTRLEKKLRTGAFEREPAGAAAFEPATEKYDIVRRKRFAVKPMSVEDAILQMELLGHQFFFFKNCDDNDRGSVVYVRNDGGYGLIESE